MNVMRIIKCVGVVTFLALCYIHLQVRIVDLAYQGKTSERNMRDLAEQNGHLTYAITMMKSARNLGAKMLNEKSKMHFASPHQIVRISAEQTDDSASSLEDNHKSNSLLSFVPALR
jgi:hypothetical protein